MNSSYNQGKCSVGVPQGLVFFILFINGVKLGVSTVMMTKFANDTKFIQDGESNVDCEELQEEFSRADNNIANKTTDLNHMLYNAVG